MYSDCRGRSEHKGSFGFEQNAEKIVQVACFFSPRHLMRKIKPSYSLPACLQELARGHHLIFIHVTLPLT